MHAELGRLDHDCRPRRADLQPVDGQPLQERAPDARQSQVVAGKVRDVILPAPTHPDPGLLASHLLM